MSPPIPQAPRTAPGDRRASPFNAVASVVGSSTALFLRCLVVLGILASNFPGALDAATVPKITVPKKKITVFRASILKPTGDPVTAGSADNEFTFTGAGGVATIPVEAKVEPARLSGGAIGNLIKWTFVSLPAGVTLSWNTPWPGEPSAGRGETAVATLTGYPASNSQFGARAVKMEVISGSKVLISKTTNIELFFERNRTATGRAAPNWFFYWNQTPAGDPNAEHRVLPVFGRTPALRLWSTYSGSRQSVWISDAVTGVDARRDATRQSISGIDLFANTVRHEVRHVQQVFDNNGQPFFSGVTGVLRNAAAAGWSFNIPTSDGRWNHFTDSDGSGTLTGPDTILDTDADDLANSLEPTSADRAACFSGSSGDVECQAELAETSPEDTFLVHDWGDPGKQHRTTAHND